MAGSSLNIEWPSPQSPPGPPYDQSKPKQMEALLPIRPSKNLWNYTKCLRSCSWPFKAVGILNSKKAKLSQPRKVEIIEEKKNQESF